MNKKISIVTVNWNTPKDTIEFLTSVKKLNTPKGYEIQTIVVDNGSTDNSCELLVQKFDYIKLIQSKTNLGFAGGYNLGISYALNHFTDYILIINNDTITNDSNLLINLIEAYESNSDTGFVAPKIYFAPKYEFHKKRYKKNELGKVIWYAGGKIDWDNVLFSHKGVDKVGFDIYKKTEETDFCTGCAILVSNKVLQKIGLFDEKYFAYLEDVDLCMRAKKLGYKLLYTGTTSILHKTSQSSDGSGSSFHDYFMTRNRLIFGLKYASLRAKVALLRESLKFLFSGRPFQKYGVYDFFMGKMYSGNFFRYYKQNK